MLNPWVWTELTELLKPDRKAGESVPLGYLSKGHSEFFPNPKWIKKGYVERIEKSKNESIIKELL